MSPVRLSPTTSPYPTSILSLTPSTLVISRMRTRRSGLGAAALDACIDRTVLSISAQLHRTADRIFEFENAKVIVLRILSTTKVHASGGSAGAYCRQ